MNPQIFKHIECHTGNDLETIGFIGEFENYFISFGADQKDNYKLDVESFAVKIDDDWWEEMIPNEDYENVMQKIINDKLNELLENKWMNKEAKDFDGNYYKLYELRPEMFY